MRVDKTGIIEKTNHSMTEEGKGIANYLLPAENAGPFPFASELYQAEKAGVRESGSINMADATYQRPGAAKEAKSVASQLENTLGMDMSNHKNQVAVLSNIMSAEDLQEFQKSGFSLSEADSKTIITVTDEIKAVLAKAGVDISGYGETLSAEQLEEITGSSAVAAQIVRGMEGAKLSEEAAEQSLKAYDLPVTEDNLAEAVQAYEKAEEITGLNEDAMAYLLKNQLPPSIRNLYKAVYSNSGNSDSWKKEIDFGDLDEQIRQMLKENGIEITDKNMADSRWLISHDIALSKENLQYLADLESYAAQLQENGDRKENAASVFDAMAEAVAAGGRPFDAMLIAGYSLWDRARHAAQVVADASDEDVANCLEMGRELTIANLEAVMGGAGNSAMAQDEASKERVDISLITARRQLEEVRLMMTVQANYALLKRGIAIDTRPLEELVEDLKEQENSYYQSLLETAGVPATEENVSVFADAMRELSELRGYPAYLLQPDETYTIRSLHEAGGQLEAKLKQAGESYEALMTAPRADLGDSIRTAFRNVDDILEDLSLDVNESNRRAVRILAYNETELTEENIEAIKAVDEEVQRTFQNLTPAVTVEMIRRGIDPLDLELSELNHIADELRAELGTDERERFSKYLWKLEQKHEISEEERQTYIGIYRLIAQVEKTDGAAIGALQKQGMELTMRNLLTAVRSRKKGAMDYQIDDEFAGVDAKRKNPAIDDQIAAAYQQNCLKDAKEQLTPNAAEAIRDTWEAMTPEQLKEAVEAANRKNAGEEAALEAAYAKEELSRYAKVLDAPEEIYAFLERYDLPGSMENVLAMQRMFQNPSEMFLQLLGENGYGTKSKIEAVQELKQQLTERFGEAVKTPEELAKAQEVLAETAERVMETMIIEDRTIRASDIRELQILCRQFTLCAKRTREEESYVVPVETEDGITGVSLKVVRGSGEKGLVDLFFRGALMGKLAASFEAKEKGISGVIATDSEETLQMLQEHLDELKDALQEDGESVDLHVTLAQNLDGQQLELRHIRREAEGTHTVRQTQDEQNEEPRAKVQTRRLYRIAETFLQSASKLRSFK